MKHIKRFNESIKSNIIDYIKSFDINKVKLPFSNGEYESFIHNLSPQTHDEEGRLIDSEYYNGFLYNSEKYCREVTSNYEYLKLVKYLFDFNNNYKFYDLGCGIGSLLYFAQKIGYKNPIGVEYQEELKDTHKKLNLDVIYGDLLKIDLSFLKDGDIIYLYKPIYDDSLANKLIDKILKNTKDDVIIIYCDPDEYFFDRENTISPSSMNQYVLLK